MGYWNSNIEKNRYQPYLATTVRLLGAQHRCTHKDGYSFFAIIRGSDDQGIRLSFI